MAILVISLDGMTDQVFEAMASAPATYPNIAKFKDQSDYRGGVRTMFVSNTYPIHASISTGKLPREHGITSNYVETAGKRRWAQLSSYIQSETIWDAAHKQGLSIAAILWPITCGAGNIRWNFPEVHLHGQENQLVESLRHGSCGFQLGAFLRHGGKLLKGIGQPGLDRFTTAVTCDLLRKHRPDLTLLHLIAYDTLSHWNGGKSEKLDLARRALDECLGRLLDAAGDATVLVFSDHGHLDVAKVIDLTQLFNDALLEQCGGSAFLTRPVDGIENSPWFGRFLTAQELDESGFAARGAALGIAAKPGYTFGTGSQRSDHGYPADYEDYQVFYALRGNARPLEPVYGDVRDITAVIANELGLTMS